MKLNPMNELERKVAQMVAEGKPLHGLAMEILMEMTLREMEKEGK